MEPDPIVAPPPTLRVRCPRPARTRHVTCHTFGEALTAHLALMMTGRPLDVPPASRAAWVARYLLHRHGLDTSAETVARWMTGEALPVRYHVPTVLHALGILRAEDASMWERLIDNDRRTVPGPARPSPAGEEAVNRARVGALLDLLARRPSLPPAELHAMLDAALVRAAGERGGSTVYGDVVTVW